MLLDMHAGCVLTFLHFCSNSKISWAEPSSDKVSLNWLSSSKYYHMQNSYYVPLFAWNILGCCSSSLLQPPALSNSIKLTLANCPRSTILHLELGESFRTATSLPSHVNVMFVSTGIEDVFLSTALGLIRLSQDSLCSSLRIYDSLSRASNVGMSPLPDGGRNGDGQSQYSLQTSSLAHGDAERSPLCC